jgi:hypothetical protein
MALVGNVNTFATAPTGDSAPDSITTANGSFFVEYGNGADSTGLVALHCDYDSLEVGG